MSEISLLKIAARKSVLSKLQARFVQVELQKYYPKLEIQFFFLSSFGDRNLDRNLLNFPEQGIFTEDLRLGLKEGLYDLIIHSWKDLPIDLNNSSVIHTIFREDQRDIFILKKKNLKKIREESHLRVFTSSPRRSYQIKKFVQEGFIPAKIKKTQVLPIRGNVPTRFKKLFVSQEADALIMGKAALDRLLLYEKEIDLIYGEKKWKSLSEDLMERNKKEKRDFLKTRNQIKDFLKECLWMILPLRLFPTAAAQGALAIESLKVRENISRFLKPIHKEDVFQVVSQERKILKSFGGGCHQNIGVSCLRRDYGDLQFYRGDFPVVEKFFPSKKEKFEWPKTSEDRIFPLEEKSFSFFSRFSMEEKSLKPPPLGSMIWVSRQNAFPKSWKKKEYMVWTAGLQTWKELAHLGVWVRGSSESLGEWEEEGIEKLLNLKPKSSYSKEALWTKLTHSEAPSVKGKKKCPTYFLKPLECSFDLETKTHFYWKSSSQFLFALKKFPSIKKGFHASGPGHTFSSIKNVIPPERRKIFLSYKEWKRQILNPQL